MIARRSFLAGILAAGAAPAIARAESLMRVVPVESGIIRSRVFTFLPQGWDSFDEYAAAMGDGLLSGLGIVRQLPTATDIVRAQRVLDREYR